MNYSNPTEPGALLKAALVCAGVVKLDNHENLATQLAAVRRVTNSTQSQS